MLLMKLAVHYYSRDFSEAQAASKTKDMVDDLEEFPVHLIERALVEYRQDGQEKFFPTSGQLRDRIGALLKEESDRQRGDAWREKAQHFDSRPIMWWMQDRRFWKPHWRESDIPEEDRAIYLRRRALKEASAA